MNDQMVQTSVQSSVDAMLASLPNPICMELEIVFNVLVATATADNHSIQIISKFMSLLVNVCVCVCVH